MFLYCWNLALVMMLIIPVYLQLYFISNRINKKSRRKITEAGAVLENQLVESIRGIRTVRRFSVEDYFNWQTKKKFMPLMQALYQSGRTGLMLNHISEFHTQLLTIILLWTGSYFVMGGEISQGVLLSFYVLTGYFTAHLQALMGANKSMQDALIAADRLFEIIDLEREKDSVNPELTGLAAGDVEFSNVHFRYGMGNKVFDGLNLVVEQQQITAIVGKTGSGKSTLVALLQRLYHPEEGSILIGGTDIRHAGLAVLRRKIAVVPQQTDLFRGTIASNIALGEEEPDMQRIFGLCRRLGLHEFIDQLPGQYQAQIHEQGINFSGGRKQRIAIARALYRDPEILILEEAGASPDPESERKVLEALQWFYSRGKTIIVMARHLSIVKHCHRILLIKDGRLAAAGTHDLLMRENKEYAGWWH
jgi:ATP-binding cassette subfamily B protein